MPIILPDSRKRGGSVVEDAKMFSMMNKKEYEDAPDMEEMKDEAAKITAKFLIQAVKEGNTEKFVEAFKQMLELCED